MLTLNIFANIFPKRLSCNRATGNFNIKICYQTSLIRNRHYAGEKSYKYYNLTFDAKGTVSVSDEINGRMPCSSDSHLTVCMLQKKASL
jgi:hypothetical protein